MRSVVYALALAVSVGQAQTRCSGDCNADGSVSVSELVSLLPGLALGGTGDEELRIAACLGLAAGEPVAVHHLVIAVNNALEGCPTLPTPTPDPMVGVVFDPPGPGGSQVHQWIPDCSAAFELRIAYDGPPGRNYVVDDLHLSHGYSQGDYSRGFTWNLGGVELPAVLDEDRALVIPMTYNAESTRSRLHVAVNPMGREPFGALVAIYRGESSSYCQASPE